MILLDYLPEVEEHQGIKGNDLHTIISIIECVRWFKIQTDQTRIECYFGWTLLITNASVYYILLS